MRSCHAVQRWDDDSTQEFVFGRSDARDEYVAFAHDDRGVYRVFPMTFGDGEWTLLREDPDFHQRIVMRVEPDRIDLRADASEDAGKTPAQGPRLHLRTSARRGVDAGI